MTISTEILAMGERRTNAELIRDCAALGYLDPDGHTLDPTYGLGRWWTLWRPTRLARHDIDPAKAPDGPMDFTALDYPDDHFDTVVFDPPYKLNGTGGSHPSDGGYGVAWQGVRRPDKHDLVRAGLVECIRVTRHGGYVLAKGKDQVESGRKRWQVRMIVEHAEAHGCTHVDSLHVRSYVPQPKGRRQVHARTDYSTLVVLRKEATA
jgi:hypothetical protein